MLPPRKRKREEQAEDQHQPSASVKELKIVPTHFASPLPALTPSSSSPSSSSILQPFWQQSRTCLLPLLHADLIPIVLAYAATIDFAFVRMWGSNGKEDGQLNIPLGLCAHKDELFLADTFNSR